MSDFLIHFPLRQRFSAFPADSSVQLIERGRLPAGLIPHTHRIIHDNKRKKQRQNKGLIDTVSAVLILQNFMQLQDELAGTENRLAVARRDYNTAAQQFNTKIKTFPTNVVAGMLGFSARDYFQADEAAKKVPQVKF